MYIQKTITRADGSQYNSWFWINSKQQIWSNKQEATSNWLDQHGSTE
jgi:hypothetical protein